MSDPKALFIVFRALLLDSLTNPHSGWARAHSAEHGHACRRPEQLKVPARSSGAAGTLADELVRPGLPLDVLILQIF